MSDNPYAASPTQDATSASDAEVAVDFVPIMRRWERLRIVYNGSVGLTLLLLTAIGFPQHFAQPGYWILLVVGGLVCNLCFFTAPAIEGYGVVLKCWHASLTYVLFVAGLAFTLVLGVSSVIHF